MSIKQVIRSVVANAAIAISLLLRAPLNPNEIDELLHRINQPKVVHTLREREDDDDD